MMIGIFSRTTCNTRSQPKYLSLIYLELVPITLFIKDYSLLGKTDLSLERKRIVH